jgi:hypothetical protein
MATTETLTVDQFLLAESLLRSLYTGQMSEAGVRLMLDKLENASAPWHRALLVCVRSFIQENPEKFAYFYN